MKGISFCERLPYVLSGLFDVTRVEASSYRICCYHRDRLGIYWRGRRKRCQVPPEVANHKDSKMKGDRSVLKCHSIQIKQITGKIVPVGSGKEKKIPKNFMQKGCLGQKNLACFEALFYSS